MPIDKKDLHNTLKEMKQLHVSGRRGSYNENTRNQTFIRKLHAYAIRELNRVGIKDTRDIEILTEKKVLGSFKEKNVDILVRHKVTGPLLIISVKSIMSSITSNFTNVFEGMIGDSSALHERFPYLIMVELILLPKKVLVREETYPLDYYSGLLCKLTGRTSEIDDRKKYERIGLLVVDFETDTPTIDLKPIDSRLRIEGFFDDIKKMYDYRYADII